MASPGQNIRNHANDTSTPSRWRRNRPNPNPHDHEAQPVPATSNMPTKTPQPKVERSASKMSLFNLFSRPKVERARGHTEVGLAVPMGPPQPPPKPAAVSTPKPSLRVNSPPAVQQTMRSRSSQMLRPISMRTPSLKKESGNWDPPPLFQAYPQAIKHATVQACVYSPDAVIRTQSQRKQHDLLLEQVEERRGSVGDNGEMKKLEKSHKRLTSNSITNPAAPQLTDKIYVLVTSGYVLEYSGNGSFDRLPEKVLKLGKESAAFACDAIPGKHFVLQISQSAKEDGTVALGPKNSFLSRLRSPGSAVRRAATSFLLVLDSAEELKAWMTVVRKEIENFGGMKAMEDAIRESVSSEEAQGKQSQESATPRHRYLVRRDPSRMSKVSPVDSPLQSQYSESPKIVTSDWEADRSERTVSMADSASIQSSRVSSSQRRSEEVASIATTSMSQDQQQLDQLRERSRYSYVSTATSVSASGTRNTSQNSSPAPSPRLKEGFSPADTEPLRSATSLRSFHMNPNSHVTTNRRRSMQPLPVTNEDTSLTVDSPLVSPQRHSMYGQMSPTLGQLDQNILVSALRTNGPVSATPPPPAATSQLAPLLCKPTRDVRYSTQPAVRPGMRSSSAPPVRRSVISPPPRDPAPPPGRLPHSLGGPNSSAISPQSRNRLSQGPKPFLRPFPVRPQAQHVQTNPSLNVPRRLSSLGPPPAPINRSVTAPVRPSSAISPNPRAQPNPQRPLPPQQQLRRPNSVQIRSDHAPFLSSSRPTTAPIRISSTPSFVQGKRMSTAPNLRQSSSMAALRKETHLQPMHQQGPTPMPRRSMPVINLTPPAPPPNMPLPPPPPNMPLPRPPPNMPLPLPPSVAHRPAVAI